MYATVQLGVLCDRRKRTHGTHARQPVGRPAARRRLKLLSAAASAGWTQPGKLTWQQPWPHPCTQLHGPAAGTGLSLQGDCRKKLFLLLLHRPWQRSVELAQPNRVDGHGLPILRSAVIFIVALGSLAERCLLVGAMGQVGHAVLTCVPLSAVFAHGHALVARLPMQPHLETSAHVRTPSHGADAEKLRQK